MISAALDMQAGRLQMQVAAAMLKSNAQAERGAVETLLGAAQQSAASLANVASGIGGSLNVSA